MSIVYGFRYIGCALLLSAFSFDVVSGSGERENGFACSLDGGALFRPRDFNIFITPDVSEEGDNVRVTFDSRYQLMCLANGGYYIDTWMTFPSQLDNNLQGRFRGTIYSPLLNTITALPLTRPALPFGFFEHYTFDPSPIKPFRLITDLNSDGRPLGETDSGIIIKASQRIASYRFYASYLPNNDPLGLAARENSFIVHVHPKSDVVLPFRGCDVSSGKVNVTLGDYPRDISEKEVDLSLKCPTVSKVSFSLSGKMQTETIFSNVAPISPATGIGIQLVRDNKPVPANTNISMGSVGKEYKSLGLKARYALDGQPLGPGNVQAVIGVNFTYN